MMPDWTSLTSDVWSNWTTSTSASNNITWQTWTSSSTDNVWPVWVDSGTCTSTNTVWCAWVDGVYVCPDNIIQLNEEGLEALRESQRLANEKWQKEQEEQERKRKEANERADELLKAMLTPEQIKQLDELSHFIVTAPSGNVYQIKRGRTGNVYQLNEQKKPISKFCIHSSEMIPDADTMLSQKLMLETNEPEFLRIANRTALLN